MILAYIDAGTGAMLLQWIIAIVIGSGIFFRGTIVGFLKRIFGRKTRDSSASETEATSADKTEVKPE